MQSAALSSPAPFWAAARVARESLALVCLAERKFETFAPRIETGRHGTDLLFPMHVFVLIVTQWRAIDCTPGVLKLIRFGDTPAKIPDAEIAAIRARADSSGIVRLPPAPTKSRHVYKAGDKVRVIVAGTQFDACHSGLSGAGRERVFWAIMGTRREISVASHLCRPA
jgi:transcriptional antiterminator RfaH